MEIRLVKKVVKKADKNYVNFFIVCENGYHLPIQVVRIKDQNGETLNKSDYVRLDTIAERE